MTEPRLASRTRSVLYLSLLTAATLLAWWLARPQPRQSPATTAHLPASSGPQPRRTALPDAPGIPRLEEIVPASDLPDAELEELLRLAAQDPAAAAQKAVSNTSREKLARRLLEVLPYWAEKDPLAALDWLFKEPAVSGDRRAEFLASIISTWAWKNPEAAAFWLKDHLTPDAGTSVLSLLAAWSSKPGQAGLDWVRQNLDASWRQKLMNDLLMIFPSPEAHSFLEAGVDRAVVDRGLAYAGTTLGRKDPKAAATMFLSIRDTDLRHATADGLIRKIASERGAPVEVVARELGLGHIPLMPRFLPPAPQGLPTPPDNSPEPAPELPRP